MSAREVNAGKCLAPVPALGETTVRMGDLHLGPGKLKMKMEGALTTAAPLSRFAEKRMEIVQKRREIAEKRRERPFCVLPRRKRKGGWVGGNGSPWGTRCSAIPKVKNYDRRLYMFSPSVYHYGEYEDSDEDAAGGNPKEEEKSTQMSD